MEFPLASLQLLLKFVQKKEEFSAAVLDAALEVVKYAYHYFLPDDRSSLLATEPKTDEEVLTEILDTHNSKVVSFSPMIWVMVAQIALKIILNRFSK